MTLIDQQIIDSFFKYYKKDIKTISQSEFENLKEKISQNLQKIIDLPESREILLKEFSDYKFSFFHVVAKFGKTEELKKIINLVGIKNINISDVNNLPPYSHFLLNLISNFSALIILIRVDRSI